MASYLSNPEYQRRKLQLSMACYGGFSVPSDGFAIISVLRATIAISYGASREGIEGFHESVQEYYLPRQCSIINW